MSLIRVSDQNIEQASGGNSSLRNILQSIASSVAQQQSATSTSPKSAPSQAQATVRYVNSNYVVEITNPDNQQPLSPAQAQSLREAGSVETLSAVTTIYHQLRCATSLKFDVGADVQTFGGAHGSAQVYWTISGVAGTPARFFQFRSSFDGFTWNQWKTANNGSAVNGQSGDLVIEDFFNARWATFTLPGGETVAVGQGRALHGDTFGTPSVLFTSDMKLTIHPDGFPDAQGHLAHGWIQNDVGVIGTTTETPSNLPPVVHNMYADGEGNQWPGYGSFFGLMYDPAGKNVRQHTNASGTWVEFILPGGSRLAWGMGDVPSGGTVVIPDGLPWVRRASAHASVTVKTGYNAGTQAEGVYGSYFNDGDFTVPRCLFQSINAGSTWSDGGRWTIIAWSPGLPVQVKDGGWTKWVLLETPAGTRFALGAGRIGPGSNTTRSFSLPDGDFSTDRLLTYASAQNTENPGHPMAGVLACHFRGTLGTLTYTDISNNYWGGDVNYLAFAWEE